MRQRMLLVTKGIAIRSKELLVDPGLTTRNKKPLVVRNTPKFEKKSNTCHAKQAEHTSSQQAPVPMTRIEVSLWIDLKHHSTGCQTRTLLVPISPCHHHLGQSMELHWFDKSVAGLALCWSKS